MRKPTSREAILFCILALLGAIVVAYVLFCIFAIVIGIVIKDFKWLGLGFGGLTLPLGGYVVIGDIKALFF